MHEGKQISPCSQRDVRYINLLGTEGTLHVPTFQCPSCKHQQVVKPEEAGCVPTSGVQARTWVDEQLMQLFMHLKQQGITETRG